MKIRSSLIGAFAFLLSTSVSAQGVDLDKVLAEIENLKSHIKMLEAQVKEVKTTAQTANQTAEVAIETIEEKSFGNGFTSSALEGVSLGGYGELHYNNLDSGSEIDFHRFVLFFGKQFTDKLRFFSEFELEHALAGDGKPGEVELEQAFIEYSFGDYSSAKAGLFLVPVGILNETHEPPTFHGVERNGVEKEIIPSTWWEAGAAYSGSLANGLSYDVAFHSGLNVPTEGKNAYRIRSGRQKVAEAKAEDFALTGRVKYTGVPGLELSLTAMRQADITQGSEEASATLIEAHAVYRRGPFGMRALYAEWDIDSDNAAALGKDSQDGFYLEPSYTFNDNWSAFLRYSEYNTTAGFSSSEAVEQFDVGVNWNLHENVVIKADIQNQSGSKDDDGFNLGVGYQF
jgi:predicted porin